MRNTFIIKTGLIMAALFTVVTGFAWPEQARAEKETEKSVKETKLFYNPSHFTDQEEYYYPNVSEVITYTNGEKEIKPESLLSVAYKKNLQEDAYQLSVISGQKHYEVNVPIITVTSITTKTKVSTKKPLSAKNLKLLLCYSDGTVKKIDSSELHSDVIKQPKEGINQLTCYYNEQAYTVNVKAYNPDKTVSFKGYGSFTLDPKKSYKVEGATRLTPSMGVTHFNNHRETYYSQRVLPGTALDIPGRHVAEDGTVRDKDGYICVASAYSFCSKHEVLLTSLGPAKVYDTGCAHGTIDLYVNW